MSGCGSGGGGDGYAGSSVSIWLVIFAVGKRITRILPELVQYTYSVTVPALYRILMHIGSKACDCLVRL